MTLSQKSKRRKIIQTFSELREEHRFCHLCGEQTRNTWEDLEQHFNSHIGGSIVNSR